VSGACSPCLTLASPLPPSRVCRESKFIQKASQHKQHTAQRFTDEDALLAACFYNLEEDIVTHERRAARMHLRRSVCVLHLSDLLCARQI
jgi:hypothetical protein